MSLMNKNPINNLKTKKPNSENINNNKDLLTLIANNFQYKEIENNDTNDNSNYKENSIKNKNNKSKKDSKNNIKSLSQYTEIKLINDENQLNDDLKEYKSKNSHLFEHPNNEKEKQKEENKVLKNLIREALTNKKINNKEKNKNNLKEDIAYQIINNNINPLEIIEKLYIYNPERNIKTEKDIDFIFNTPLKSNGKTLIYISVQEGKKEILQYFLNKGLNPKISSFVDNIEETPLECACRWNYIKIINLLLEKEYFNKKDIVKALKIKGISNQVSLILKNYLKQQSQVFCFC